MMMDIEPIETYYQGWHFRSRLEARWAVFFDRLGIQWEYEPEGVQFKDGTKYLPDFWMPTFNLGLWAEVKHDGGDFSKARMFCEETHNSIWLCEGSPDIKIYTLLTWTINRGVAEVGVMPNVAGAKRDDRMWWVPGFDTDHTGRLIGNSLEYFIEKETDYVAAVQAARSARFEFNKGGPKIQSYVGGK
jgi:hypothetical protein